MPSNKITFNKNQHNHKSIFSKNNPFPFEKKVFVSWRGGRGEEEGGGGYTIHAGERLPPARRAVHMEGVAASRPTLACTAHTGRAGGDATRVGWVLYSVQYAVVVVVIVVVVVVLVK